MRRIAPGFPFTLWVVLIALTSVALGLFEGPIPALISSTAIILIAAVKSRLVILHYMEAKRASSNWKFLYETWNFTCAALIIIANSVTLLHQN